MRYYVDNDGYYLGAFQSSINKHGYIPIDNAPLNVYQRWSIELGIWIGSEDDLFERYKNFRIAILNSSGWRLIRNANPPGIPEFIGAVSYMNDTPRKVKDIWNILIPLFPIEQAHIDEWKAIVNDLEVGLVWIRDREFAFDFDDNGLMQ